MDHKVQQGGKQVSPSKIFPLKRAIERQFSSGGRLNSKWQKVVGYWTSYPKPVRNREEFSKIGLNVVCTKAFSSIKTLLLDRVSWRILLAWLGKSFKKGRRLASSICSDERAGWEGGGSKVIARQWWERWPRQPHSKQTMELRQEEERCPLSPQRKQVGIPRWVRERIESSFTEVLERFVNTR